MRDARGDCEMRLSHFIIVQSAFIGLEGKSPGRAGLSTADEEIQLEIYPVFRIQRK